MKKYFDQTVDHMLSLFLTLIDELIALVKLRDNDRQSLFSQIFERPPGGFECN